MAQTNVKNLADKNLQSYSDLNMTTGVEMTLTSANTNYPVTVPSTASFVEFYASADSRMSLSTTLAAKSTDVAALAEGNFIIAYTLTARQLPGTTTRILYLRSATAGAVVQVNFCG